MPTTTRSCATAWLPAPTCTRFGSPPARSIAWPVRLSPGQLLDLHPRRQPHAAPRDASSWHGGELYGFGVSAFGLLSGHVCRTPATSPATSPRVEDGELPLARGYRLTTREMMTRDLALGMKLIRLDRREFQRRYGFDVSELSRRRSTRLFAQDLMAVHDRRAHLDAQGILGVIRRPPPRRTPSRAGHPERPAPAMHCLTSVVIRWWSGGLRGDAGLQAGSPRAGHGPRGRAPRRAQREPRVPAARPPGIASRCSRAARSTSRSGSCSTASTTPRRPLGSGRRRRRCRVTRSCAGSATPRRPRPTRSIEARAGLVVGSSGTDLMAELDADGRLAREYFLFDHHPADAPPSARVAASRAR